MKRILLTLLTLIALLPLSHGQVILRDDMQGFSAVYTPATPRITVDEYTHLFPFNAVLGGSLGAPALPVQVDYLTIPFCDSIEVRYTATEFDTLTLQAPLYPRQPSASKNSRIAPSFAYDSALYSMERTYGHPLFEVEPLGIARDRQIALLRCWPVQVNHAKRQLIVCRQATVELRYHGADSARTQQYFEQYYSPAFNAAPTLNKLLSTTHFRTLDAALRLTIVVPTELKCQALDEFVAYKRTQGYLVDLLYTDLRSSAEEIATSVRKLFEQTPAPTFLLLIGDHEQLPAFASNLSADNMMHDYSYQFDDHITDHYYTTITDDLLPDCHRGRFPATDTLQLSNMIDKTLYYERYQFTDDNYLGRAVLVAGVDAGYQSDYYDNAYRCADPSMDYIALHYVNADHGFSNVRYYKNNYTHSPSGVTVSGWNKESDIATKLVNIYNEGIGWINYSAHGNWNKWTTPAFTVANVLGDTTTSWWGEQQITPPMNNKGMPSFMIGNCCLSNHFDSETCLGEALLRRTELAGAIGYIGATNSTFWDEDFYWSVGVRNNVYNQMSLDYKSASLGVYDRLFHTHSEPLIQHAPTAGEMLTAGMLSVASHNDGSDWGESVSEYYWEIYQFMGDPTLIPWLGKATLLPSPTLIRKPNERQLLVQTKPGSYVALIEAQSHELRAAAFAHEDGYAYFTLPDDQPTDSLLAYFADCLLSITHQSHRPYLEPLTSISVGIASADAQAISLYPNPATGRVSLEGEGMHLVQLLSIQGQLLRSITPHSAAITLPLDGLAPGLYLVRILTDCGITVRKLIVE